MAGILLRHTNVGYITRESLLIIKYLNSDRSDYGFFIVLIDFQVSPP